MFTGDRIDGYVGCAGADSRSATPRGISQSSIFSSRSIESRAGRRKAKAVDDVVNSVVYNIVSDMLVSRELFDMTREDGRGDESC